MVVVGHSLLLALWRELGPNILETLPDSVNRNFLIVTVLTMDVLGVEYHQHLPGFNGTMVCQPMRSILTLLMKELATMITTKL